MAAGEYVSVSSQSDIESADLKREQEELDTTPEIELRELAKIYIKRGLTKETALETARQLTAHDALEAHARDELGINEITTARPLQAALASGAAFVTGGIMPLIASILLPLENMVLYQYLSATFFLAVLGALSAKTGGSSIIKSVLRISFWGTIAMGLTALVGYLFNISMV
jgi:VIT1/CCC1 family predicted Fe2+/Mn2+ transporter